MVYPHIRRPSSLPLSTSKSSVVGDIEKATGEAEVEPLLCAIRSQISLALMRSATVHELDSLVQFTLRSDFQNRLEMIMAVQRFHRVVCGFALKSNRLLCLNLGHCYQGAACICLYCIALGQ